MTEANIDRNGLYKEMDKTTDKLLTVISAFDQENINIVPFEGSWTAAQVAEHLLKSYGVVQTVNGRVEETKRDPLQNDSGLKDIFLNFEKKLNSPDFILPEKKQYQKQQLLSSLTKAVAEIKHAIQTLDLTASCLDFQMPGVGSLTRAEWLYFALYHTKRHIHQLENIFDRIGKK